MKSRPTRLAGVAVLALLAAAGHARAQQPPSPGALPVTAVTSKIAIPDAAQPSAHFDVADATDAYIAEIPAAARAHSDAYFEGGYWLILWDFLYALVIYLVLLRLGWSARMRELAERITHFKPLQTLLYWTEFLVVTSVLGFPLAVYEGYFRERHYGLATQTLVPWLGDQLIMLLVNIVMGGILAMLLFGVVRRWPRSWWFRCAAVSMIFMVFGVMIAPVFIFPLFNKFTVLDDPKVTQPILSMARANGIPAQKVYQMDASRQTTRMSANVSGYGQTMRITLNDNLLRRGSPEEIQAVMGHEMGHYVLHHIAKDLLFFSVLILIFFGFLRWSLEWSLARWGARWRISGIGDTAVVPLVFLLGSIAAFVITPFFNTHIRTNEFEADMYGLNASRQPDGFAEAAIHLGEYRKMSPTPMEEWIFFDHPSGRNRIRAAMRWKAENLQLFTPKGEH
ncbi:MAG TPA: M48 family metallopeptidase [Candidatus Dormibacteraeota bacterium]|nr:M48 family metallopeptidase [Candidatus Dormibacteraeota bacterium]